MACNPNIIGTMGLAAAGRAIPAGCRDSRSPEAAAGARRAGASSAAGAISVSWGPVPRREQAVFELPVLGLLLLVFSVSILLTPDLQIRGTSLSVPLAYGCPLFTLTGIPCLLCGMTRSFLAMGGLDLGGAFTFHPLGPMVFIALAGLAAAISWSLARGRRIKISIDRQTRGRLITTGALVLLIAWAVKLIVWRRTGLI
ncbi:MAG: DUF2752 domain-containing protein [Thermoleophilia bacterium]